MTNNGRYPCDPRSCGDSQGGPSHAPGRFGISNQQPATRADQASAEATAAAATMQAEHGTAHDSSTKYQEEASHETDEKP